MNAATTAAATSAAPDTPGVADAAAIAHYGVLVGLFEFIPVPFVDDFLQERALRHLVEKLLRDHGRTFDPAEARPLWAGESSGIFAKVGGFVKGLVLKPVKKLFRTVTLVFAIRRAALDGAEALLLGHTLDRLLGRGYLADAHDRGRRRSEAEAIRVAVDRVWDNADVQGLKALVRSALTTFRKQDKEAAERELAAELDTPEARGLFARFDAAVDARLAEVTAEQRRA